MIDFGTRVKAANLVGFVREFVERRKIRLAVVDFGGGQVGEYPPDKLTPTRIGETVRVARVRDGASTNLRAYVGRVGTIRRERSADFVVEFSGASRGFYADEIEVVQ